MLNYTFLKNFNKSYIGSVIKNSLWAYGTIPITLIFGIINTGILSRMIGPEGIGTIALLTAITGLIYGLFNVTTADAAITFGIKHIVQNEIKQSELLIKRLYTLEFLCSIINYIIIVIVAFTFKKFIGLKQNNQIYLLLIFGLSNIFTTGYWISQSLLRVGNKYSWVFWQTLVYSILKTIIFGILYYLKYFNIVTVVVVLTFLVLFQTVSITILARYALKKEKGIDLGYFFENPLGISKEIKKYLIYSYGRTIVRAGNIHLDVLILKSVVTLNDIGLYRAGKQISEMMLLSVQGIGSILHPEYSLQFFQGDTKRFRQLFLSVSLFAIIISLFLSSIVYWQAPLIVNIIFGDGFFDAVILVRIMTIAGFIRIISFPMSIIPRAVGDSRTELIIKTISIIIIIIGILILVPIWGIRGAALAIVGGAFAEGIYLTIKIINILKIKLNKSATS